MRVTAFCFSLFFIFGCLDHDYDTRSIETRICVVESIEIKQTNAIIGNSESYIYHTDCGVRVVETGKKRFSVGDTINLNYVRYLKKTQI